MDELAPETGKQFAWIDVAQIDVRHELVRASTKVNQTATDAASFGSGRVPDRQLETNDRAAGERLPGPHLAIVLGNDGAALRQLT